MLGKCPHPKWPDRSDPALKIHLDVLIKVLRQHLNFLAFLSMSNFVSFAVIGAGDVGKHIIEALVTQRVSVIVLSRPVSAGQKRFPGAKLFPVDYTDYATIRRILTENKVDVVISTIGVAGMAFQKGFSDVAKAVGVKLFVPSEFGMPTNGYTEGYFAVKEAEVGTCLSVPAEDST